MIEEIERYQTCNTTVFNSTWPTFIFRIYYVSISFDFLPRLFCRLLFAKRENLCITLKQTTQKELRENVSIGDLFLIKVILGVAQVQNV